MAEAISAGGGEWLWQAQRLAAPERKGRGGTGSAAHGSGPAKKILFRIVGSAARAAQYLSTIKDLFDGFIVAHQFGRENSIGLVRQTLNKVRQKEKVTDGLILHSDQGHQYTSHAYAVLTQQYNIIASMSRRANCWDNAPHGKLLQPSQIRISAPSAQPHL